MVLKPTTLALEGDGLRRLHFSFRLTYGGFSGGEKVISLQAGAADENTVYAMLTEERRYILRFDAPTVLNRHPLGPSLSTDSA